MPQLSLNKDGSNNDPAQPRHSSTDTSCRAMVGHLARMCRVELRLYLLITVLLVYAVVTYKLCLPDSRTDILTQKMYVVSKDNQVFSYDRLSPLIFIGGYPRSGTTLMRVILDAHPDVRCGQETRLIPTVLFMRDIMLRAEDEAVRLEEAGVDEEVFSSAIASFCLELMVRHGNPAPRLCNKDPFTIEKAQYLLQLFPNAKFLFMVRDARAVVHSMTSRKIFVSQLNLSDYRECIERWNYDVAIMYEQCQIVGPSRCMMVYYEQMVLHPAPWMRQILSFLDLTWNDNVLHHEDLINKPGGAVLSKLERSTDQVINPVNVGALTKWVGQIPQDVVADMAKLAPMLAKLGYDPYSNPPNYSCSESFVADDTLRARYQQQLWEKRVNSLNKTVTHDQTDESET